MRKTNLFFIGTGKTGSTALHKYFEAHPEIFAPEQKELHYFAKDFNQERKQVLPDRKLRYFNPTISQYEEHFKPAENQKYRVDMTPNYYMSDVAAEEIYDYNKDAKFIVGLRHPIEYLRSTHLQLLSDGYERISDLNKALDVEEDRKQNLDSAYGLREKQLLFYRDQIRYYDQIEKFLKIFPREAFFFYIYETFKKNNFIVLSRLKRFLDLQTQFRKSLNKDVNPSVGPSKLFWVKDIVDNNFFYTISTLLPSQLKNHVKCFIDYLALEEQEKKSLSSEKRRDVKEFFRTSQLPGLAKVLDQDLEEVWDL